MVLNSAKALTNSGPNILGSRARRGTAHRHARRKASPHELTTRSAARSMKCRVFADAGLALAGQNSRACECSHDQSARKTKPCSCIHRAACGYRANNCQVFPAPRPRRPILPIRAAHRARKQPHAVQLHESAIPALPRRLYKCALLAATGDVHRRHKLFTRGFAIRRASSVPNSTRRNPWPSGKSAHGDHFCASGHLRCFLPALPARSA